MKKLSYFFVVVLLCSYWLPVCGSDYSTKAKELESAEKFWEKQILLLEQTRDRYQAIYKDPDKVVLQIHKSDGVVDVIVRDKSDLSNMVELASVWGARTMKDSNDDAYIDPQAFFTRIRKTYSALMESYAQRNYQLKQELSNLSEEMQQRIYRGRSTLSLIKEEKRLLASGAKQAAPLIDRALYKELCGKVQEGSWTWFNKATVTFGPADVTPALDPKSRDQGLSPQPYIFQGTVKASANPESTWWCNLKTQEIVILWKKGNWLDILTLDKASNKLSGKNNKGMPITATRK